MKNYLTSSDCAGIWSSQYGTAKTAALLGQNFKTPISKGDIIITDYASCAYPFGVLLVMEIEEQSAKQTVKEKRRPSSTDSVDAERPQHLRRMQYNCKWLVRDTVRLSKDNTEEFKLWGELIQRQRKEQAELDANTVASSTSSNSSRSASPTREGRIGTQSQELPEFQAEYHQEMQYIRDMNLQKKTKVVTPATKTANVVLPIVTPRPDTSREYAPSTSASSSTSSTSFSPRIFRSSSSSSIISSPSRTMNDEQEIRELAIRFEQENMLQDPEPRDTRSSSQLGRERQFGGGNPGRKRKTKAKKDLPRTTTTSTSSSDDERPLQLPKTTAATATKVSTSSSDDERPLQMPKTTAATATKVKPKGKGTTTKGSINGKKDDLPRDRSPTSTDDDNDSSTTTKGSSKGKSKGNDDKGPKGKGSASTTSSTKAKNNDSTVIKVTSQPNGKKRKPAKRRRSRYEDDEDADDEDEQQQLSWSNDTDYRQNEEREDNEIEVDGDGVDGDGVAQETSIDDALGWYWCTNDISHKDESVNETYDDLEPITPDKVVCWMPLASAMRSDLENGHRRKDFQPSYVFHKDFKKIIKAELYRRDLNKFHTMHKPTVAAASKLQELILTTDDQ
jgi:hypothetical protein